MSSEVESYLEGLLIGRGRLYRSQRRILIEFPHKNPNLPGIAHCPSCGWLATGFSELKCKNSSCRKKVNASVKKIYEQHEDTKKSLEEVIVPYLSSAIECDMRISPGNYSTHLFLDFPVDNKTWKRINGNFLSGNSHQDFRLPKNLKSESKRAKTEFVNGLLDTAGFVNSGGWLPRDGENGHGRMRLYFQIVRNWPLVVEIDNFLRREFDTPIQTIDWGHPNIRSAGGTEGTGSSTTREHQIKIFPEYMEKFQFRISCKQALFLELLEHNISVGFTQKEDWFPPRLIPDSQRKPIHPHEEDLRLPVQVRKHFDAFWQINLELGCEYLTELSDTSVSSEVFSLTGDLNSEEDIKHVKRRLAALYKEREITHASVSKAAPSRVRNNPEYKTYEPLRVWLEKFLRKNYDSKSVAWITAEQNLSNFLSGLDHKALELVENLDDLRIRPDIVGVIPSTGQLAFIESKVTNLNLREVGQLLGYSLVAQPLLSFLISNKPVDTHLDELIKQHPSLVEYGDGNRLQLLYFNTETMKHPERLNHAK